MTKRNITSAIVIVSGLSLPIPGAVEKLLNSQLVNAVLAQVVIDNFSFDQIQNLPVVV